MKVLQLNFVYLKLLGICSDPSEPHNDFLKSFHVIHILFAHWGPLITFSTIFVYYNFSDIHLATEALIVITAGISSFGGFLSLGTQMKWVKLLYNEIQAIVDAAEHTPAFKFYVEAERSCHFCTKWSMIYIVWAPASTFPVACILYACFSMNNGNWDPTTYFLPYKMLIPFVDYNSIGGYFAQVFIQIYAGTVHAVTMITVISYFVCHCLFIDACCQEFRWRFDNFNELTTSEGCGKKFMEIRDCLRRAVALHIKIMEYVHHYFPLSDT